MKNILTLCALLILANIAYADEDECPAAVDAAEAQNQNLYKNCDYTQTGLNGVLHKAFAMSLTLKSSIYFRIRVYL